MIEDNFEKTKKLILEEWFSEKGNEDIEKAIAAICSSSHCDT